MELVTGFTPCGDQPQAVERLTQGVLDNKKSQVLLGVTGSGKTFTIANVISRVDRPVLVLAHNKTLAAQLYQEFKDFFPNNAVEYFVSYYDYYQPEAYIPRTDRYIEKEMSINDKIERLRLSATRSLLERRDVIIVASVSCIYGLGLPEYFEGMKLTLSVGDEPSRDDLLLRLISMHYNRNDVDFGRRTFRVRGDVLDIFPAYEENTGIRIEFFGDEIEKISTIDTLTGKFIAEMDKVNIYPGSHHVTPEAVKLQAMDSIKEELKERMQFFEDTNDLLARQRIEQRTSNDLDMIREIGFCKGVENYSRHFAGRLAGQPPSCLLDYFPDDFLLVVDESHQTIPQTHAMYHGDRSRKQSLVDFGFRLPSSYDNRPQQFEEFYNKINQTIYVSATPAPWEIEESAGEVVEQIIRPTGLLDPEIIVRPASGQVDDVLDEIQKCVQKKQRVLVTTLTKRLAEELSEYLQELGVKAKYLHSSIDTLERIKIINELRIGEFDVLVGINLLREGLDLPEVVLVAILDADKEGFLRSARALIQTCGRASRNIEGHVIMYADKVTRSMKEAMSTTEYRRKIQHEYNIKNNITPRTIQRKIQPQDDLTLEQVQLKIQDYKTRMEQAARDLDFENAIHCRNLMQKYQDMELSLSN
jgi:excinuclease ABC subunit B